MKLRAGDWVEVRSKEEILRTLDRRGRLEELPFMPQMFKYCGQKFKVYKRAHKTCDTVNQTGGRRLANAVHLELRCDGEAYGGCQAACLIFWKEAWLRPMAVNGDHTRSSSEIPGHRAGLSPESIGCSEEAVRAATRAQDAQDSPAEPRYSCQATQLPEFTSWLPWWEFRQYFEDIQAGNITIGKLLRGSIYAAYYNLMNSGIGVGRPLRWLYERFQSIFGGIPFPRRTGRIPVGAPTPTASLNLQPGELVRVKPYAEILSTLNQGNKNRGLYFDAEAVPFCGGTYRVRTRLTKFIDEKTGQLKTTQNPGIILEGVWCQARYSDCRMFCPRSIYSWWREIWLERLPNGSLDESRVQPEAHAPNKRE
jgi:hypothetical protein